MLRKRWGWGILVASFLATTLQTAYSAYIPIRGVPQGVVKWHHYVNYRYGGPGGYAGSFFVDDTTWVTGAPSKVDTTAEWSTLGAEFPPVVVGTTDSLSVGKFVLQSDSSVAATCNFKATTVKFQVNYGDKNGGWTDLVAAYSVTPTDGNKSLEVPLLFVPGGTTDLGIDHKMPGAIFAPRMRAIVTGAANTAVPAMTARVYLYVPTQIEKQGEVR